LHGYFEGGVFLEVAKLTLKNNGPPLNPAGFLINYYCINEKK